MKLSRSAAHILQPPPILALIAALARLRVRPEQLRPCEPALVIPVWGEQR